MKKLFAVLVTLTLLACLTACKQTPKDSLSEKTVISNIPVVSQEKLGFKDGIFDDLNLTYGELVKKYGKATNNAWQNGGHYWEFENGLGRYYINETDYNLLEDHNKCYSIIFNIKHVLNKSDTRILIDDLENALDCEIKTSINEKLDEDYYYYMHSFEYEDFDILIHAYESDAIDERAYFDIALKNK